MYHASVLSKILFFLLAGITGFALFLLGVPAGWLIGGILYGIVYQRLFTSPQIHASWQTFAKIFIGLNIGSMLDTGIIAEIKAILLPFALSLALTITGAILLGWILYRFSKLDIVTALFCCIPGGASEVISISEEYGANQRIVSAFHSARIIFIVVITPFLLTYLSGHSIQRGSVVVASSLLSLTDALILGMAAYAAFILSEKLNIPAGSLIYAILIGIVVHLFFIDASATSRLFSGIAQSSIGGMIGLQFDRKSFHQLKSIGLISVYVLILYLLMGMGIAAIFQMLTPADFITSYLSVMPAGAAEMASIAAGLGLNTPLVASIQITRLVLTFLIMPNLIKLLLHSKAAKRISKS